MKKFMKVMLIIAAVFMAVGLGMSAGGVAMGATADNVEAFRMLRSGYGPNFLHSLREGVFDMRDGVLSLRDGDDRDDEEWDDEDWGEDYMPSSKDSGNTRTYELEPAQKLDIELASDELVIKAYDGEKIKVVVNNDSGRNVTVKRDSDTLSVESHALKRNRSVEISYPKDSSFEKIELEIAAGTVELMDALETDELKIDVAAGSLTNSDRIIAKKAEISVGAGDIELMQVDAEKLEAECGMGEIILSLAGKQEEYNYKLECALGDIDIGSESYSGIAKEKKITNPGAQRTLELECGMGDIRVDFAGEE